MEKPIVLFDGCCNLCTKSVQFIIDRDPGGHFCFASIRSGAGRELLEKCSIDPDKVDAIVLVENGKCLTRSDAALAVAGKLGGFWPLASTLRLLPRFLRDWSYNLVARNRHRFFGESETCSLPSEKDAERFLY